MEVWLPMTRPRGRRRRGTSPHTTGRIGRSVRLPTADRVLARNYTHTRFSSLQPGFNSPGGDHPTTTTNLQCDTRWRPPGGCRDHS